MTSLPIDIDYGTPASFRSALESYSRSQRFMTNFIEEPQQNSPSRSESDPEACDLHVDVYETPSDGSTTPSSTHTIRPEDGLVDNLSWDEDDLTTPTQHLDSYQFNTPVITPTSTPAERTPLIRKATSFNIPTTPRGYHSIEGKKTKTRTKPPRKIRPLQPTQKAREITAVKQYPPGRSTYGQTLFNSIAMLLGIGMLSEPLAFSYAGWGCGTLLLTLYGFLTCYTAKILARFIIADPSIRTYTDIGRKAFGKKSTHLISLAFSLETFTVTVALVTLYADSLEIVAPAYSSNFYKMIGLIVFLPTVFLPLSWLSIASVLGIVSSVLLIVVILIDGLTKTTGPGSIWDPQPTNLGIASLPKLGVSFGLFMAGFAGHSGIPTLARDMIDPTQFESMIDTAYFIATALYGVIGVAGYCMFGNNVSEELSQDLFAVSGYNQFLNKIVLYALVITPMTKFGLVSRPLNAILESTLGLNPSSYHSHGCDDQVQCQSTLKRFGVFIERTLMAVMAIAVSIAVPEFSSMMGILGAVFSFLICVVGPISAKVAIEKKCSKLDALILVIGVAMGLWGTYSLSYPE